MGFLIAFSASASKQRLHPGMLDVPPALCTTHKLPVVLDRSHDEDHGLKGNGAGVSVLCRPTLPVLQQFL
jgi:hypothetical protein